MLTALVSISSRILDTVKRAYEPRVHHAEHLAKERHRRKLGHFYYEFLVEWAIPRDWFKHKVMFKPLMEPGLDWDKHFSRLR